MDKLPQLQRPAKVPECAFCCSPSGEVRLLLRNALLRIRKLLPHQKYWEVNGEDSAAQSPQGIHRLIRVLFQKHQFQLRSSKGCPHHRLRSYFLEKLKCKKGQLDLAIDQLCDKLARRNYELELIALQVKNVENSVLELEDSPQVSTKTRKESQSSRSQQEPLPPTSHLVKMEPQPAEQHEDMEIGTAAGYGSPYEAIPFSYNFIYYGAPYYQ